MNVLEMVRAAKEIGPDLARSQLFGLSNEAQGVALAMLSFQSGRPLEYYQRTFHVIDGKMTMRADAMLAGLDEFGGKYRILKRDPDAALIEISARGETRQFGLDWQDAQKEPFTKAKDGKPKTNYATPRIRMQMLWARAVSDGVRAMLPKVNCGFYTPEEFDADPDESEMPEVSAPERKPGEGIDLGSTSGDRVPVTVEPAREAALPQQPAPAIDREKRVPVDQATVDKIKALIVETQTPTATIVTRLKAAGMQKLAEMTMGDAQQLLIHLQERKNVDEWLKLDLTPPGN